jgi:hypothetical protein
MKTTLILKMSLVTGLILTSLLAKPNTSPVSGTITRETERTIRNYFKFPQILIPHMEPKGTCNKVEVLFTTDRNGNVNFVLAKTGNGKLKAEIEKQFLNLRLARIKQNVVHSVVLNFKTL